AMASTLGGEAMDVCASSWSSADSACHSHAGPSARAGESPVGLSTHRRRTERPWSGGLSHDGADVASARRSRTSRQAWRDDLAGVSANASAKPARCRLLHGGDDLAATALRPFLHRTRRPARVYGWLHADSDRRMGNPTGPTTDMEGERAARTG